MTVQDIHALTQAIGPAMAVFYRDTLRARMEAFGLDAQTMQYYVLAVAHDFEPEPTSIARMAARSPYSHPETFAASFEALHAMGMLEPQGQGQYTITDEGHAALDAFNAVLEEELARLQPLPAADLARIKTLLGKLIDAAINAPQPADKSMLLVNRSSDPGDSAPVLFNLLQYSADLNAFRDDAHVAAWRPRNVSGKAWEALTTLWRDGAHTPDALAEKLSHRQYDAAVYAAALDDLAAKEWVGRDGDAYHITDAGATMRQEVEDLTDHYYYAPWDALDADERAELHDLLLRLRDSLQALNAEREAAVEAS